MGILGIGLLLLQIQLATASGTVTKPGSNEPLPGATVILNPVGPTQGARNPNQNSRASFAISEDDGRFTVRDIEPGDYRLQVQSPLYGAASYGQRKPDGPGTILSIKPGQRLSDLKVSTMLTSTIAGRITGNSGEPIAYATVQALKFAYQEGKRTLAVVQATTTDDRGEYRLFWLPSGKYLVVAGAPGAGVNPATTTPPLRPGGTVLSSDMPFRGPLVFLNPANGTQLEGTSAVKRILEDGTVREESWMPTYYPATTDRTQATPVDVIAGSNAGATVTGINITLGPSPVQRIRGRVTGSTPAAQPTVALAADSPGTNALFMSKGISPIDGSFEFAGVVPGPYLLIAQDKAGLFSAPIAVSVADRDIENLSIPLAQAIAVSARITAEGVTPGTSDPFRGLIGSLRSEMDSPQGIRSFFGPVNIPLRPGSVLAVANVPPGDYQFNITQSVLPGENLNRLYIKSLRLGREDALGRVHLSPDMKEALLEVVVTAETGAVEGLALGRSGDPASNVTVVLVPASARKRTSLYQSLITGSDGRFRFQEIPPGDYKLFAWDDVDTGAWQNAEFIAPYESRGRAVRITESSKEEVQLNVIYNQ